jgi:hypothetical protein
VSILNCDTCDLRIDTDEELGGRSDGLTYSCERCCELYDKSMGFTGDKARVLAPDRYEQLVGAVRALLVDVEDEIEQRKTSGIGEDWQPLQQLVDNVRGLL